MVRVWGRGSAQGEDLQHTGTPTANVGRQELVFLGAGLKVKESKLVFLGAGLEVKAHSH